MRTMIFFNLQCVQNTRREASVGDPNARIEMYLNHCSETGQAAWKQVRQWLENIVSHCAH